MLVETSPNNKIDKMFRSEKRKIAREIINILDELEDFLPMTVRQVYYQLVAKEILDNDHYNYKKTSDVLSKLRRNNIVPWSYIDDRTRRLIDKRGISDLESHIQDTMQYMFNSYNRCLVQNQVNYVEVWSEKDALSRIIEEAVWIYCCRVVICRGQPSATIIKKYDARAKKAIDRGQTPVILYFGDLDPTGLRIPYTIENTLRNQHGLNVNVDRCALTVRQIEKHKLPFNPKATKESDNNYAWYCKQGYKDYSVELDALHPEVLMEIIKASLQEYLNMETMILEENIQNQERKKLKKLEREFKDLCRQHHLTIN